VDECYAQRGYQIFRGALQVEAVDAAAHEARKIPKFPGRIRRPNGTMELNQWAGSPLQKLAKKFVRNPILNAHLEMPAALDGLHIAIRRLVTGESLWACLHALDDAEHYTIHQTILFLTSPQTAVHTDSWGTDTVPNGFAHTAWIPLQDLDRTSGVPCVIPWPLGKRLTEEELGLTPEADFAERYESYHRALQAKLNATSPDVMTAFLNRGDLFIWSSLTPHGTLPSYPISRERLALQVLIRPSHMLCGTFLRQDGWPDEPKRISDRFSFFRKAY
jgi:hypothetical protein